MKGKGSLAKYGNHAIPFYQKLVKLSQNRSYSRAMKQERAYKIVDKLFKVFSPKIKHKPYVYLDEETKLGLNKGFILMCLVYQRTPTVLINAMMQSISLADLYARMHLNQTVFNPALGYYLRVQNGHGDLIDFGHINSMDFKNFILDLQEFDCRYFMIRDLEKRTKVYRNRLEENFNKVNQCYDGE